MRLARVFLLFSLSGVLIAGCKKDKPVVEFEVIDTLSTTLITSTPSAYLETVAVFSNTAVDCERNKTSIDQLQSVSLSSVEIAVRPGQSVDPLQKIVLYLVTDQGSQIVFASQDAIPKGADRIILTPTDATMLPYLRAQRYFVKSYVELTQSGQLMAEVKMQFKFSVQGRKL